MGSQASRNLPATMEEFELIPQAETAIAVGSSSLNSPPPVISYSNPALDNNDSPRVDMHPLVAPLASLGPASAVPHPPQIYPYLALPHQPTFEELDIKPLEVKSSEPDVFLKKYVGNLDELVPPSRGWSMFVRLDRHDEAEKLFSCLRSDVTTIQKAYTYDPIICYFVIADSVTLKQLAATDYVRRLVRKTVFTICQ